jgi:hypothetical protein
MSGYRYLLIYSNLWVEEQAVSEKLKVNFSDSRYSVDVDLGRTMD